MISRRTYTWSALGLAVLLFMGVNLFANNFFTSARLDLTQSRQYTLSPGTRAIVSKLEEPITLRFYFSNKNSAEFPLTAAYAKRVRDLIGEYAAINPGKIILEDVNPEPFTPEEDEASATGIQPVQLPSGEPVYFGLAGINSVDTKEVIPYFDSAREAHLEYDLTSMIYQLSHPEKRKVALVTTLPLVGSPQEGQPPSAILTQLRRLYDTTLLDANFDKIPAGTNVLVVAHPRGVGVEQLREIANYVQGGGRALIFLDPLSEMMSRGATDPSQASFSDLAPILKRWGVDYSPTDVLLDRGLAQRVRTNDPRQPAITYPMWLRVGPENFATRDPVTANLQNLNLASVGTLTQTKGASTRFEPLISSSTQASTQMRDLAARVDRASLVDMVEPTGKPFTIAARVTGRAAAFPGMPEGDINVIVVADTDVFNENFWLRDGEAFAGNGNFILSAVENLSGSNDMISLRMRGITERPFTVVRTMQAAAEARFRETLQSLQARLTQGQQQIAQLQQGGSGTATALTAEQTAQIAKIRREIGGTRAALRDVQRNLRTDIDRLGVVLAFFNILAIPLLVAGLAIAYGIIRRKRARGARRAA